jgi:hypothetical protein
MNLGATTVKLAGSRRQSCFKPGQEKDITPKNNGEPDNGESEIIEKSQVDKKQDAYDLDDLAGVEESSANLKTDRTESGEQSNLINQNSQKTGMNLANIEPITIKATLGVHNSAIVDDIYRKQEVDSAAVESTNKDIINRNKNLSHVQIMNLEDAYDSEELYGEEDALSKKPDNKIHLLLTQVASLKREVHTQHTSIDQKMENFKDKLDDIRIAFRQIVI